jgi:hypothetical protein
VVGTVILFGFLILALSLYQVQIVPQQNAQVEFQHFEEVRNDLVELRAGILQAGSIDRTQYQTVRLGTSYSTRLFTINPPTPTGTIRTTQSYPITISNGSDTVTIPTRFLEYRPGYNELDRSSTWYDASVLYLNATENGGGIAVIEDQELVDDGGKVRVVALQNEFRRSGTGRVTLELRPAEAVTGSIPEGDVNVTIPTRLSGDEYWDDADIPAATYGGATSDANGDGVHNLTLETTADNLTVDTVGVQESPENPTQNADGALPDGGGGDGGGGGSGGSGNDVKEVNFESANPGNSGKLEFTLKNTGSADAIATAIVVNNTTSDADGVTRNGNNARLKVVGGDDLYKSDIDFGTRYDFLSTVTIAPGSSTQFELRDFTDSSANNNGKVNLTGESIFFTIYFDDGSKATFEINA